jgi:hypothetical protein
MDQRTIISKMPSSMMEKAQSSMDPKAMGVKIMRKNKVSLIIRLTIVTESLSN